MTYSEKIVKLRKANGYSQEVFAKLVGVSRQAVYKWEAKLSVPELDLIVRTGGDLRISNFLLWQAAYAELYFTDVLWPDFGPAEVDAALAEFSTRKRRFGGV